MKIRTLVMALAAFSLMLTACGNNQAKQEQQQEQQEQQEQIDDSNNQEVVEDLSQEEEDSHSPAMNEIRSVWKTNPLSGVAVDGKTDIERFANVFCNEYPKFDANRDLAKYLKDPDGFGGDTYYNVDIQKQNGYIHWNGCAVVGCDLTTCYWNCDNGHKLVAFWMAEDEDEPYVYDRLLLFYDYDPATDKMNPAPALVEPIENLVGLGDQLSVSLPDEGKDINISIYHNLGDISFSNYLYRWNGNGFDLEKTEEKTR